MVAGSVLTGHSGRKRRPRLRLLVLLIGVTALTMAALAGVAHATVSNVTADNSSVSQAVGARTVYKIGFTAATTLTTSAQGTGTITIGFPSGTDLTQIFSVSVTDSTTGVQVGNFCSHSAAGVPPTATCSIFNGSTVRPGDAVLITLGEVANPGSTLTNPTVSLFTSSETTAVNSAATANYQVVGQNPVTNVTADNSSVTQAAGARTVYKVGFTASATGGLAGAAGSQITITLPNTSDITQIFSVSITDTTTATQVGNFCAHTAAGVNPPVLTCSIFNGSVVRPGDAVLITLDELTNPTGAIANPTVSVSTTSDTAAVNSAATASYQVVGQNPVTNVTADNSSVTQAAGARTVYKVGFTASATGGLAGAAGSQITITLPNTSDITQIFSVSITDTTTATQVGNFCAHTAAGVNPPVLTCSIFNGSVVRPGDAVLITLDELTNPTGAIANPTVSVSTTSDTAAVNSAATASYQVVGQNPVTNVTADNSSVTQAAGARTVYKVGFTASATGGLAGAAGSQITITLPNTSDITQIFSVSITDTTTATQVGNFCAHTAAGVNPPVLTCSIFNGSVVRPGDAVLITLDELTNPTGAIANPTVSVSTTSDTAAVNSAATPNYQVVTGHQISAPSIALSNQAPSAAGVTYTVGFTTSSTGGLAGAAGSQITITVANGTDLTHISSVTITDTTTGIQVGNFCAHTAAGVNPPILTCSIFNGSSVGPAQGVSVKVVGITNPATTASDVALISTSSDLPQVAGNYSIGGNPPPPTVTSISPPSGPAAGGTAVTINGANFTGATVKFGSAPATITSNAGNQMTVTAPPGTGTVDVIVTNAGGSSTTSPADRFTYNAAQSVPVVSGGTPTTKTSSSAAVSGSVNPGGTTTTAFFQYGLDPSYRGPGASTTLYDKSTPPLQVGSDSTNHTISASLSGLVPGALYHVRLVATNSRGTTFGADQTFTTAAAPAPPPPVLGVSENAQPVSGTVFIRLASGQFVRLTGAQQIPSGAVIDARRGTLKLTTATGGGSGAAHDAASKGKNGKKPKTQTQSGNFGGAIFKVTQARAGATKGLVTLKLLEAAFNGAPSFATCKKHKAGDASAAAASSKVLQLLRASAHGKFRTQGRYSAATVRGTIWTVADRCDGTLTHDVTDSVVVTDFVRHKTIVLHAGQSYLAKTTRAG